MKKETQRRKGKQGGLKEGERELLFVKEQDKQFFVLCKEYTLLYIFYRYLDGEESEENNER